MMALSSSLTPPTRAMETESGENAKSPAESHTLSERLLVKRDNDFQAGNIGYARRSDSDGTSFSDESFRREDLKGFTWKSMCALCMLEK